MTETEDLLQLRLLSLKLLRQLQVGQYAVQRSVAKAASEVGAFLRISQGTRKELPHPQDSTQASSVFLFNAKLREALGGKVLGLCDLDELFQSGRNSRGSYDPEMPLSPKTSSVSSQASGSQDRRHMWDPLEAHGDDPCDVAWLDRVSSRAVSQPPVKCQHLEPSGQPRSHSAPSLTSIDSKKPAPSAGLHDPAPGSIPAEQSKQSKVTRELGICQ